jgi:hypothetical protein
MLDNAKVCGSFHSLPTGCWGTLGVYFLGITIKSRAALKPVQ